MQNHKLIIMSNYDDDEYSSEKDFSDIQSNYNPKFRINYSGIEFLESNLPPNNISLNENDNQNLGIFEQTFNEKIEESEDLTSRILMISKKRKIFHTKKLKEVFHYKQANYLIRFITAINQYYIKIINDKIKKHTSFQDIILHTPSYEFFSEKIIIKENRKKFLNKTMKDILKEKEIKNRKDNSNFIKRIEDTNDEELISSLNMKYKDVIKEFYDSFDFELFKYNREIKFYDRKFKKRHKSLFEKYGLIESLEEK